VRDNNWAAMALRLEQLASELVDVHDVGDTMDGVLSLAVRLAPCDVASVSLRHSKVSLETTAASEPVAGRAHELQQELGEGPCVDVEWDDEGINIVPDVTDSTRWPRWSEKAQGLGLGSLLAVRLFTTRETIGALDLYSVERREYDNDDILVARLVAARVSAVLANLRHEETLWDAIDSRHQVGLAQGILMERYQLSAVQAFAVLRRYSQEQNRKLRLLAEDIIEKRALPGDSSDI
jgi:GAF domain-containing protein